MIDELPLFAGFSVVDERHTTIDRSCASDHPTENHKNLQAVDREVLAAIRNAIVSHAPHEVTIGLRDQLQPETYARVKELLLNYGFAWKASRKTHLGTPADWVNFEAVIESGLFFDSKRELEFFATSDLAARELIAQLQREIWSDAPRILEPSGGDGTLVAHALAAFRRATVTAIELDPIRARVLRKRFAGTDRVRIIEGDILELQENGYDAVLMNPPFGSALEHIQAAAGLARRGAPVVGIAMLSRPQDRALAKWLNESDAETYETEPDAFRDTTVKASFFCFRNEMSYFKRLQSALAKYPTIGTAQIDRLCEISRDLHILFADHCNGDIEEDIYEPSVTRLTSEAHGLVALEGIRIAPAWDPRAGHGFKLILPSGETNDVGTSGMIVPDALPDPKPAETRRKSRHQRSASALSTAA